MAVVVVCAFVNQFTRRSRHPLPHFVPIASAKENHENPDGTIISPPLLYNNLSLGQPTDFCGKIWRVGNIFVYLQR